MESSDGPAGPQGPAAGAGVPEPADTARARSWTFLTNHAHVLLYVTRQPQARIRDIAAAVGITERAAQAILGDLEHDGYVSKTRVGRRNSYTTHPELRFRHPLEADQSISELVRIFSPGS